MNDMTLAPFGRGPVSLGQLIAARDSAADESPLSPRRKWEVFHDLTTARACFGISDRDLSVLNALLSFLPGERLDPDEGLVVFPSNRNLSARAHGMPESTLRRHLAALVRAGLLHRRDSPNGKRFARRGDGGAITRAFGFDLRPLLLRAPEIADAARAAREAAERLRLLREDCSLLLRDCLALLSCLRTEDRCFDAEDDALRLIQRALRRKLGLDAVEDLRTSLRTCRDTLLAQLPEEPEPEVETPEMSGSDAENERHHESSDKDSESERAAKTEGPSVPLEWVRQACRELKAYDPEELSQWRGLVGAGQFAAGMMGIHRTVWEEACASMGPVDAAISVGCILERFDRVRSPGGYLRSLSAKAREGRFSTRPMVAALLTAVNRWGPEPHHA
ncbi:plasmid replication protein RepC [Salipiger sp.]|uniref:plasmid replication protein RepC n=1 Tax=Salipiger sp. TaxID=2078585 RepID=UPI003A97D720